MNKYVLGIDGMGCGNARFRLHSVLKLILSILTSV